MKILAGVAALAAASLITAAPAAAEIYGSLGWTHARLDFEPIGGPGSPKAESPQISARVGWDSGSWYAAEAELGVGLSSDALSAIPPLSVKIQNAISVFGVAYFPIGENFRIHGRVGYTNVNAEFKGAVPAGIESHDSAPSYGVGASYKISEDTSARFDYTVADFDAADTTAFSLSFVRTF